ncbi:putative glutamate carboxypeptidase 2 [Platanthera guangdongensis]|uniref:Glutamate carboxypeptidase 2 n=1 Tax=Platanthera guangdongensis TaxID=2320717 RepID=A0ABR2M3T9_9ASPA
MISACHCKLAQIQNIISIMKGYEEPDRYVILGSHRYSWIYGVVDPNNGAFILLDVSRHLGALLCYRWSPKNTIILCSWDAEEFGMWKRIHKESLHYFDVQKTLRMELIVTCCLYETIESSQRSVLGD